MKLITAVIRPASLSAVRAALITAGIGGLTVAEASLCNTGDIYPQVQLVAADADNDLRMQLEIAVVDDELERVLEALLSSAPADSPDNHRIFVTGLTQVLRTRTGEEDNLAIRSE